MGDALVHIRVPAALKTRWVRDSRAAGMRLTDWIIERISMQAQIYDVTLYWHDGGSVFLGTVAAMSQAQAEKVALLEYSRGNPQSDVAAASAGFQTDAVPLPPDEAADWLERNP